MTIAYTDIVKPSNPHTPAESLTYQDLIKHDPHPYLKYFPESVIQGAMAIESQRRLAERFQQLSLDMARAQKEAENPRLQKIMERLRARKAKK
jgi:hypothetical protein